MTNEEKKTGIANNVGSMYHRNQEFRNNEEASKKTINIFQLSSGEMRTDKKLSRFRTIRKQG